MIILDIETTGFDPHKDEIIEVGAIRVKKRWEIDETFSRLIKPTIFIPLKIQELTGITMAMVHTAPRWSEIAEQLREFIGKDRIFGWNVSFDKRMLVATDPRFSCFNYQDYLKYVRGLGYNYPNYKLSTVARHCGLKKLANHRALDDTLLILGIMKRLGCLVLD